MKTALALALSASVVDVAAARVAPSAVHARRWTATGALAIAGLWALVFADLETSVGRFGPAAPVGVATWLLASAVSWPTRRLSASLVAAAAAVATGAASLEAGRGDLADAAGGLAIAGVVVLAATRLEDDGGSLAAIAGILGAAAIALGLVRLEASTGGFVAGGGLLTVGGSALVALGATTRARRAASVLLPLALALGLQAAPELRDAEAVALGIAALACAWRGRLAGSLALWALAAAAVGAVPGGYLLGAASVVALVWLHPVAAVVALPGAASLAFAVGDEGSLLRLALGGLAIATAVLSWRSPGDEVARGRPPWPTVVALAIGAWLLLAPESWGWVGDAELDEWGSGVVVAALAAALTGFVATTAMGASLELPPIDVADPLHAGLDPRGSRIASVAALGILGAAGAALVASVVS